MIQIGLHLYSVIYQVVRKRKDKKFFEFLLHHIMALILVLFSYSLNLLEGGSITLLVHDITDIAIVFGRGYSDYKNKNKIMIKIVYFITLTSWVYFRMIVFPFCLIWTTIKFSFQEKSMG